MALLDNLLAYWKLDEASGSRVDAHNSNDLTDNNTVGAGTGKINSGADFEASNSEYLSLSSPSSPLDVWYTAWTVSLWLNIESFPSSYIGVFARGDTADQSTLYLKDNGKFATYIDGGTVSSDGAGSQTLSTATWYHVVWSYSTSTGIQIWVNLNSDLDTADTYSPSTAQKTIFIGNDTNVTTRYFDGIIDEVGLWSRVLTSDERSSLYNSGSGLAYDFSGGGAANVSHRIIGGGWGGRVISDQLRKAA